MHFPFFSLSVRAPFSLWNSFLPISFLRLGEFNLSEGRESFFYGCAMFWQLLFYFRTSVPPFFYFCSLGLAPGNCLWAQLEAVVCTRDTHSRTFSQLHVPKCFLSDNPGLAHVFPFLVFAFVLQCFIARSRNVREGNNEIYLFQAWIKEYASIHICKPEEKYWILDLPFVRYRYRFFFFSTLLESMITNKSIIIYNAENA